MQEYKYGEIIQIQPNRKTISAFFSLKTDIKTECSKNKHRYT